MSSGVRTVLARLGQAGNTPLKRYKQNVRARGHPGADGDELARDRYSGAATSTAVASSAPASDTSCQNVVRRNPVRLHYPHADQH